MNTQGKSALAVAVAAIAGGASTAADAAVYTATLTQLLTYSNNGTSGTAANITSSTATFSYDDVSGLLTQTGGLFNIRLTTSPTTTLYRTSITGLVLGNSAAATATEYTCTEGNFGTNVGASICGNYNFGANAVNDSSSSWGPGLAFDRTIGGDDGAIGAQQSIAGLNNFANLSFDPTPVTGTLVIANKTCTGICTTTAGGFNAGQQWTLGNLIEVVQGTVDDTANAVAGVATDIDVLANDQGFADPVTVTILADPDNGGSAAVVGSPGNAAGISITYTALGSFAGTETFTYRAVSGALDDVGTVTVTVSAAADTTPDAFSFAPVSDAAASTVITSAAATIAGINQPAAITITGGEYSINGGAFVSTAGTVEVGQTVTVRQTSSAAASTATTATVTIGGVTGDFVVTTAAAVPDTTPDAFTFAPQNNVAVSTVITSAAAVIAGIDAAAPITITGGEYSINGGGFVSTAGTITTGQSVVVRQTSSATAATPTTATLTIGGVNGAFVVTTAAAPGSDLTPDQFSFVDQPNVDRDIVIESEPVEIVGIDGASPIVVTGGEYSINAGAYTSAAGTVVDGDLVTVRHTSASTSGTAVTTTLSVGPANVSGQPATRISDAFTSSTRRNGGSSSADGLILGVLGLLGLARRRNRR